MVAQRIDGKAFAAGLRAKIAGQVAALKAEHGITPGLAVVLVGDDPASQIYVASKGKQTVAAGMNSYEHRLPADAGQAELLALIGRLNADPEVHGILVQLPLPAHIDETEIINAIAVKKDVDGFNVANAGRLATGQRAMVPCTPLGCLMLLRDQLGDLSGKSAVVIGRSNIVGKPMAALLLADSATVTVAHSRTQDLPEVVRGALMHGKTSPVEHNGTGVFSGLPSPFMATRYHSLVVEDIPDALEVNATAETPGLDGKAVMGFRHRELPIHGVQFHPESILSERGHDLLRNFFALARDWRTRRAL